MEKSKIDTFQKVEHIVQSYQANNHSLKHKRQYNISKS